MTRLVVIAGPANTGKMPLARSLMADDPDLALVHRDDLRRDLGTTLDEWHITLVMAAIVRCLLALKRSVIVCAWNMEPADYTLWNSAALEYDTYLEWLDVRLPQVAAMIPPMETT